MAQEHGESAEIAFFRALGGDALVDDVETYEAYFVEQQRLSAASAARAASWNRIGEVISWQVYDRGVRLQCEQGNIDLFWWDEYSVRVWARQDDRFEEHDSYLTVDAPAEVVAFEVQEQDDTLVIGTGQVACWVRLAPLDIQLRSVEGVLLGGGRTEFFLADTGAVQLSMALAADESGYGMGERAHRLDLRGGQYAMWNTDQPNCDPGTDPLYYCVPFYLGVHAQGTYGMLWDNPARGTVHIDANGDGQLLFTAEQEDLRYFLVSGAASMDVLRNYSNITGKIELPPLWYLGYHQSRFSYYPQETLLDLAQTFRQRNIPCDALYLDIHYMDTFKVGTWDEERFPDFAGMVNRLHQSGFRVVPIIDPGVRVEASYEMYESGIERDVFVKAADGEPLRVVVWAGTSHLPDFTRADTHHWWQEQLAPLLNTGVDGIWNDMNEPAVFVSTGATTLPDTARYADGRNHVSANNVYGMGMAQATRDALLHHRRGKRPVNITRAGTAGTQRYASAWTGDVSSAWEHLRLMIPMVLNMNLSGAPLTGADVGGFRGDTNAELLTRWMQAGALMPFYRNHTAIDTVAQEPWAFGEPYERIMRAAIELRYRLMPYLYAQVAKAAHMGVPIVQPMFMMGERDAALRDVDDQFMLGQALLVAPVLDEGATERDVVLPDGEWYDFYTHMPLMGGQTLTVEAPLDRLPLFVRGGCVLPMWEVQQHLSGGFPADMRLRVFPGNLETTLYEDEGESLDYLNGMFRWLSYTTEWVNNRFWIRREVAGEYEQPYKKLTVEIVAFDQEPIRVRVDQQAAPVWYYENRTVELSVTGFEQIEIIRPIGPSDETISHRPF